MFEHIVTMLAQANESLKSDWEKMFYTNANDVGLLQNRMYEIFDEKQFEKIKLITNIHKLTYKKVDENNLEGSYLDYIINN